MTEACVVVGGGIAGAVAAATLARAGQTPLLLERSREAHHKVCGEFISWEAADRLASLGLDLSALGASRISRVRLFVGTGCAEASLPGEARGVSRFRLDEALLTLAARAGVRVERGLTVRSVAPDEGGMTVHLDAGEIRARTLLLATGKSELRGVERKVRGQRVVDDLVGFKAHYRLSRQQTAALQGAVELHLLDGGYAGLQLIEEARANLCLLVGRGAALPRWDEVLDRVRREAPVLGERLDGAEPLMDRPLAVSAIPYGFLHRPSRSDPAGLLRLGDQCAVVHSFTGDGMAIAAMSGAMAPEGVLTGLLRLQHRIRRRARRPVRISSGVHRLLSMPRLRPLLVPVAAGFPELLQTFAKLTRVP